MGTVMLGKLKASGIYTDILRFIKILKKIYIRKGPPGRFNKCHFTDTEQTFREIDKSIQREKASKIFIKLADDAMLANFMAGCRYWLMINLTLSSSGAQRAWLVPLTGNQASNVLKSGPRRFGV